jgi:hypothetical protein
VDADESRKIQVHTTYQDIVGCDHIEKPLPCIGSLPSIDIEGERDFRPGDLNVRPVSYVSPNEHTVFSRSNQVSAVSRGMTGKRMSGYTWDDLSARGGASGRSISVEGVQGKTPSSVQRWRVPKVLIVTPKSELFGVQNQFRVRKQRSCVVSSQAPNMIRVCVGQKNRIDL